MGPTSTSDEAKLIAAIQANKEHFQIINFIIDLVGERIQEKTVRNEKHTLDWYFNIFKRYPIEDLMQSQTVQKYIKRGSIHFEIRICFENMETIVQKCSINKSSAHFIFNMTQYSLCCDVSGLLNKLRFKKLMSHYLDKTYRIPKARNTASKMTTYIVPNKASKSKQVTYFYSYKLLDRVYCHGLKEKNLKFYNWLIKGLERYVLARKNSFFIQQQMNRAMLIQSGNLLRSKLSELDNVPTSNELFQTSIRNMFSGSANRIKFNPNCFDFTDFNQFQLNCYGGDIPESVKKKSEQKTLETEMADNEKMNKKVASSNLVPIPSTPRTLDHECMIYDPDEFMELVYLEAEKKFRSENIFI